MASASASMVARWSCEIRFARRDTPNAKYNASSAKGSSQNEDVERNQEARSAAQTRTMEPGAPQRRRERDWGNAAKTVPPLPGARREAQASLYGSQIMVIRAFIDPLRY